jgi:hypothetical protein
MPEFEIIHTFAPRPENLPENAVVFNAPRPIHGLDRWMGEFRHGRYYAALRPEASYSSFALRDLRNLDAVVIQYHSTDELNSIREEVQAYYDERFPGRVDVSEHADRTVLSAWHDHVAPKTVKLEAPDDEQ